MNSSEIRRIMREQILRFRLEAAIVDIPAADGGEGRGDTFLNEVCCPHFRQLKEIPPRCHKVRPCGKRCAGLKSIPIQTSVLLCVDAATVFDIKPVYQRTITTAPRALRNAHASTMSPENSRIL